MTTIKQMICRAGMEHKTVLKAIADGRTLPPIKAYSTANKTLVRWGAIANGRITSVGSELLSALSHNKKDSAHAELIERGALLEKKEDRWGDTKSGYWMDTCFLGKDPINALQILLG